jgi:hypothetical protein
MCAPSNWTLATLTARSARSIFTGIFADLSVLHALFGGRAIHRASGRT